MTRYMLAFKCSDNKLLYLSYSDKHDYHYFVSNKVSSETFLTKLAAMRAYEDLQTRTAKYSNTLHYQINKIIIIKEYMEDFNDS